MGHNDFIPAARRLLLTAAEVHAEGVSRRSLRTLVERGDLRRIRPGFYVAGDQWGALRIDQQHVVAILAAQTAAASPLVFSHRSAATLMGAPVWSSWLERLAKRPQETKLGQRPYIAPDPLVPHISVTSPHAAPNSRSLVRHRALSAPAVFLPHAAISCTTLARTAADLARSEPMVIALACVDALLHRAFAVGNEVDVASVQQWRAEVHEILESAPRAPGNVPLRALLALADPGAGSPLESVSRLRMLQLGVEFESQRRVRGREGRWWYVDFWFPSAGMFGECDGRVKYTDRKMRGNRTAEEVLYAEKRRQEWIEGSTRSRGVRWGAAETSSRESFARMCHDFGIPYLGRPLPGLDERVNQLLLKRL